MNTKEPAFPFEILDYDAYGKKFTISHPGLSKLELFTAIAFHGLLVDPNSASVSNTILAESALKMAQSVLKALEAHQ